jgi:hypothetical protein
MTAAELANVLGGRRTGPGRYQAPCPGTLHARGDRNPSLSICKGRDGRTLLKCRVGCRTENILNALGLSMRDLFDGPPLSPQQAREADRQRQIAEAEAKARRLERRLLADKYRALTQLQHDIAARLARMPEGEEGDRLAVTFHRVVNKVREIETIYDQQEAQGFHERLCAFCKRHGIDRQRLLAPFMVPDGESTEAAA